MTTLSGVRSFGRCVAVAVLFALPGCKSSDSTSPRAVVGSVAVTIATTTLNPGQTSAATVVVKSTTGQTLTDRAVTWQSGTPAVATVAGSLQGATVTSVAAGTATITATSEGISGSGAITVVAPVNAISELVVAPTAPVIAGPGLTQAITTTPTLAAGASITYANSTNNAAVATVATTGANPVVTAVSPGTATITITATATGTLLTTNSLSRTVTVTVTAPPNALTAFTISPTTAVIPNIGGTQIVTTTPTLAAGATITYANSSANSAIVTVTTTGANPVITAIAPGTATVTINATAQGASLTTNTIQRTVAVTVSSVATVQLTLANTSLAIGQTSATTVVPKDIDNVQLGGRTVTAWGSTNNGVATVNSTTGVVTAIASGTTTISAIIEGKTGTALLAVCVAGIAPPAGNAVTRFASATLGNDATGTGTCFQPYKTITKTVATAPAASQIRVSPGLYDAALGETFPITLGAGMELIGDEPNKGQGAVHTTVNGGDVMNVGGNCGNYAPTIYSAGKKTTIAGLEIINAGATSGSMTLVMRMDSLTIRNNVFTGNVSGSSVLYICNGSRSHNITGNRITNNNAVGIGFIQGGANSLVENNIVTNNRYGFEFDSEGGDLGGGARGSVGNNIISCNVINDIWTNNAIPISALNNFWDHLPLSGNDFQANAVGVLISTGAKLATSPCI